MEQLSGALMDYSKVVSIVCPDDACRHFDGNKRACAQTKRLQNTLEAAGLDHSRVSVVKASGAMPLLLIENINAILQP